MRTLLAATAVAVALAPVAARADSVSGSSGGLTWTAQNNVIGQTSTATIAGGGNPIYTAPMPKYSGVVALIMDEGAAGLFICSGSLLPDRMSILTAGHCVSHGAGTANPISTTAYFYGGNDPDTVVPFNPLSTAVGVSRYTVNSAYTGEVIDQNDIAVLRLATAAPDFAASYAIDTGGDLTGQDYNIAGYGVRSDVGGAIGADLGTGRLRQGDNRYDFRLGDPAFGGFFAGGPDGFFGTAANDFSYISDFDNGTTTNDASCKLATLGLGLAATPQFCNTGLGATEVSTGGGDSGGPQFINGQIASITGFGLTFGTNFGDVDNKLNDSFGEFNGFIPTFIHAGFIADAEGVPEPAAWALMIAGFGLVGAATRRQRRTAAATA